MVSALGAARYAYLARAVNFRDKIEETGTERDKGVRALAYRRRKFIMRRPVNLVRLSASLVSSLNLRRIVVVARRYYRGEVSACCIILRVKYRVVVPPFVDSPGVPGCASGVARTDRSIDTGLRRSRGKFIVVGCALADPPERRGTR